MGKLYSDSDFKELFSGDSRPVVIPFRVDVPAKLYCDGEDYALINANIPEQIHCTIGKHSFSVVSVEYPEIHHDFESEYPYSGLYDAVQVSLLKNVEKSKKKDLKEKVRTERKNQEEGKENYVGYVNNRRIVFFSKEALRDLISLGWYWSAYPSDEEITTIIDELELGNRVNLNKKDITKIKILSSLESIKSGFLKNCFDSFVSKKDFNKGKAELLMRVVLEGKINSVTQDAYNELCRLEPKLTIFRRIKYWLLNEWDPILIGGKLEVQKRGGRYRVVAYTQTGIQSIVVWSDPHVVVKSAEWEGYQLVLWGGFAFIKLDGPRG